MRIGYSEQNRSQAEARTKRGEKKSEDSAEFLTL